ncbi:MAG: ArsA-related P-loop ATPase [Myxococcota bacterium]
MSAAGLPNGETPLEAPAARESALLRRRLVIVTGKGGTGKTTVAAALARAAASRGLRVLVAEMARDAQVPRLLDPGSAPVGYEERRVAPGIWVMRIDPFAALAEYLGLQIGVPGLVSRVIGTKAFRQLMDASPGWRELITLGKVWHLEQMQERGTPRYDLIVVDAPATGHGVTFLDVPRVVANAVRAGPLRQHTLAVEAMIADAERTLLLPVTLAEELPTRETLSLVQRVRDELSIHLDRVVVNGVHAHPFPQRPDLADALERLPSDLAFERLPAPPVLARCARHVLARHELNARYTREIADGTGLPQVHLPYLVDGVNGPEDVARLAEGILATPAEVPA